MAKSRSFAVTGPDRRREAHDLLAPIHGWFAKDCEMPDLRVAKALLDVLW